MQSSNHRQPGSTCLNSAVRSRRIKAGCSMCGEYNAGENEIAKNKEDAVQGSMKSPMTWRIKVWEAKWTSVCMNQRTILWRNEQIGWTSVGMIQWTKWMNVWMNECFSRPCFEWTNEQGEGAFACENEPWFDKNYSISDNKKDEWVAASRSLQPPTP